jgi:signal transduction histidine kinase
VSWRGDEGKGAGGGLDRRRNGDSGPGRRQGGDGSGPGRRQGGDADMPDGRRRGGMVPFKRVFGPLVFLLMFSLAQFAGYSVAGLVFHLTGRPPDALAHILSALLGVLLLAVPVVLANLLSWRDRQQMHDTVTRRLTDALAQIAQGNFNVLIDTDDAYVHPGLATAINDMAQNLGNLETMRQDFISNVSHEIQSPLTSIGGFAELLQDPDVPTGERLHYAGIIRAESRRLSSLSDNLLKLSSLDDAPLSTTEFRLDRQLQGVVLMLEPQWSAKDLTVEAHLQKCLVSGDKDLLSQVWGNLLHNAIKFTPVGGILRVSLDEDAVRIADTGTGIPKEGLPHVFERFYKADKARDRSLGGNGLGLSLVKKIVELHDGRVSVESELGKGTAFEVFLPSLRSV